MFEKEKVVSAVVISSTARDILWFLYIMTHFAQHPASSPGSETSILPWGAPPENAPLADGYDDISLL
jgi:hypothetical protein